MREAKKRKALQRKAQVNPLRPRPNYREWPPEKSLPLWRGNEIYDLIFDDAVHEWELQVKIAERPLSDGPAWIPRPVVLEEYRACDDSEVEGCIARAWLYDERGLVPMDMDQWSFAKARTTRDPTDVITITFCIWPDLSRVTLGIRYHPRAGFGTVYRIVAAAGERRLEADTEAGFWQS
jgi:hypothetical protein